MLDFFAKNYVYVGFHQKKCWIYLKIKKKCWVKKKKKFFQAFQQIPVMTSGANLVQIIHNAPGAFQNHHQVLGRQTIIGNLKKKIKLISFKIY